MCMFNVHTDTLSQSCMCLCIWMYCSVPLVAKWSCVFSFVSFVEDTTRLMMMFAFYGFHFHFECSKWAERYALTRIKYRATTTTATTKNRTHYLSTRFDFADLFCVCARWSCILCKSIGFFFDLFFFLAPNFVFRWNHFVEKSWVDSEEWIVRRNHQQTQRSATVGTQWWFIL